MMVSKVVIMFCACLAVITQPGLAQDSVLTIDWLTLSQEQMFATGDGVISTLWEHWDGRDSLLLLPATHTYPGNGKWESPADAGIVVKIAGGVRGLYVLAKVRDDTWIDSSLVSSPSEHYFDGLCLFHDILSLDSMASCADCLANIHSSWLTYTSKQLTFRLGGTPPPEVFYVIYTTDNSSYCKPCEYPFTAQDAADRLATDVDICTVESRIRAIEYRLPWAVLPLRHLPSPGDSVDELSGIVPARGQRCSFAITYFDNDSSSADSTVLAWAGKDPWSGPYWGGVLFGSGFPDQPTEVSALGTAPGPSARGRIGFSTGHGPSRVTFNIVGQRLEGGYPVPVPGLVIERRQGRVGRAVVGIR